jgi:hypothetical protein
MKDFDDAAILFIVKQRRLIINCGLWLHDNDEVVCFIKITINFR